ncbi:MAG: hypothetical protein JO352_10200 [Chloroflexi bacterium]|nr:hypothetical protein [Chloroflexota bacterium]
MSLKGTAFLAMWHDIAAEGEREYNIWHTREHMPERVGSPGFEVGRRYVDWNLTKYRYFTFYEGAALSTFNSAPYLERLNAPTEGSQRVQPYFLNFIRAAARIVVSTGHGLGGALLIARVDFTPAGKSAFIASLTDIADGLIGLDGVTGVHIGVVDPEVTSTKTAETELKKDAGESVFDATVLVEGIGRRELEAVLNCVRDLLTPNRGIKHSEIAIYDLAYVLTSQESA